MVDGAMICTYCSHLTQHWWYDAPHLHWPGGRGLRHQKVSPYLGASLGHQASRASATCPAPVWAVWGIGSLAVFPWAHLYGHRPISPFLPPSLFLPPPSPPHPPNPNALILVATPGPHIACRHLRVSPGLGLLLALLHARLTALAGAQGLLSPVERTPPHVDVAAGTGGGGGETAS